MEVFSWSFFVSNLALYEFFYLYILLYGALLSVVFPVFKYLLLIQLFIYVCYFLGFGEV